MPPNQARSNIHAANPQAAPAEHGRRCPQVSRGHRPSRRRRADICTADKLKIQYWVLCAVYIAGTTFTNTYGCRLPATVS